MKVSVFMIIVGIIFLCIFVGLLTLIVRALLKYIHSKDVRQEKSVVRKTLGEALKAHRTQCKMTQEFVAETIGVSRQAVSKWENGTSDPSTSNLFALAKLYGVSVDYILGLSINSQDLESLSQKTYAGKTLKTIVDDLSALNNDNLISVIKYIEFLKNTQKSK